MKNRGSLLAIWQQSRETGTGWDRIVLGKHGLLSRKEVFIDKALTAGFTSAEIMEFLRNR